MSYWTVLPEWLGETCFILASGPSIYGLNARQLFDCGRVIAINTSYRLAPFADVLYFCDSDWWKRYGRGVLDVFTGRYIVTMDNLFSGVRTLRNTGDLGLETDPGGLHHGSNSGFQAINLAYHFGAKRIVLLGYDMQVSNGRAHWHEDYPGQTVAGFAATLRTMLPKFSSLVNPLKQAGVQVLNATPQSALECWPKVSLSEILRER